MAPAVAPGKDVVVIVSVAGATVIVSACVSVTGVAAESRTCAVKLNEPEAVGVPEMAPVLAFRVNPPGNAPLLIDHV